MLEKNKNITELWNLKHFKDNKTIKDIDYSNKLVTKIFSSYIFKNNTNSEFLYSIENLLITMLESNLIIRNWFNYTKNKYDNNYNH